MNHRASFLSVAAFAAFGFAAPALAQPPAAQTQTQTSANFTDEQLSAFVAASTEVQPLTEGLAIATPEARTAATAQIGAALERHSISAAAYNDIATRAQTDTVLGARINTLRQAGEAPADHPTLPASPQ